ncbi:hypothetical protein HCH_02870 [Hahella chejuensis KCTC 2396]|uniref:Uncharacterized protein n=1 Tax=Hahella chejuensis (strain KCTC 2396) TaxID=349521 RepID=Q2SI78_HAHCH|nr:MULTISPECIES: hypothetical protein [Hahella]ABC29646.1 hypothetical protein HCH_02870 [Hahella chejuensis KCTC 2396]
MELIEIDFVQQVVAVKSGDDVLFIPITDPIAANLLPDHAVISSFIIENDNQK